MLLFYLLIGWISLYVLVEAYALFSSISTLKSLNQNVLTLERTIGRRTEYVDLARIRGPVQRFRTGLFKRLVIRVRPVGFFSVRRGYWIRLTTRPEEGAILRELEERVSILDVRDLWTLARAHKGEARRGTSSATASSKSTPGETAPPGALRPGEEEEPDAQRRACQRAPSSDLPSVTRGASHVLRAAGRCPIPRGIGPGAFHFPRRLAPRWSPPGLRVADATPT